MISLSMERALAMTARFLALTENSASLMERPAGYRRQSAGRFADPANQRFTLVLDRVPTPEQMAALPAESAARVQAGRPARLSVRLDPCAPARSVAAAVAAVRAAGLRVWRVEAADLVTLADIAARTGRSREAVRRWATGDLGPGDFPPPLNPGAATAVYSWVEVRPWIRAHLGQAPVDRPELPELVAADLALRLREITGRLGDPVPIWELLLPTPGD